MPVGLDLLDEQDAAAVSVDTLVEAHVDEDVLLIPVLGVVVAARGLGSEVDARRAVDNLRLVVVLVGIGEGQQKLAIVLSVANPVSAVL